jgi:ABC-2 type transport system ATP-binding protein
LRILLGLAAPTPGSATISGLTYQQLPDSVRQVGAALDSDTFHPGRSASQHLKVIATATGLPHRRVAEVLDLVGLTGAAGRRVGGYSPGMRQRLSLAGALLGDPGVLVLDEPLNRLGPEGIRWIRGLLRALAAEGRTVLVSSHLLSEVAHTVDEVVVLSKGHATAETTLAELAAHGSVTRARSTDATRLAGVLLAAGIRIRLVDGGQAGLPILELSRQDEDLETLFFNLVHDRQEVAA